MSVSFVGLAGLWDSWKNPKDPEGREIEFFTIIVRPAIGDMIEIHDRMPAILPKEAWNKWMELASRSDRMKGLLADAIPSPLEWYPVSKMVNSAKMDGEELVRPVSSG